MLAIGLAAFVLWQLIVAIADPEHRAERHSLRRRLVRLEHFSNGAFHSVFVSQAVWGLFGLGQADDERQSQAQWTAQMFALPVGRLPGRARRCWHNLLRTLAALSRADS